jgi:DNA-binding XRE family transcriptional regulator
MEFEKKKRDSGDEYAINPNIEVKADKTELKAKESTDVEFTLKDCDGKLLKNRKIDLSNVTLGQFDPAEVTTDDEGKAKSKFTAGDVKGTAVVSAVNSYKRAYATGEFASEGGTAFIQIEEPPHWMAEGDYKWSTITNDVYSGFGTRSNEENYRMEEGSFVSSFKVKENLGDYFSENPPVAVLSQGKSITRTKYDYLMSIPQTGTIRENNLEECIGNQSLIADAEIGVAFFQSGDKQIQFTSKTPMTFNGSLHNYKQTCDVLSGCSVEENNQDCSNMELNLSFGLEAGDITIITDTTYYGMGLKVNETRKLKKTTEVTGNKYKFTYLTNSTIQMFYNELGTSYKITKEQYAVNIDVTAQGLTGIEKNNPGPTEYALFQNYPNPFNPSTTITYKITAGGLVSLKVYNPLGEEIKDLVNEYQSPGLHSVKFSAGTLPSGIYVYRLKSGSYSNSKKFILLK